MERRAFLRALGASGVAVGLGGLAACGGGDDGGGGGGGGRPDRPTAAASVKPYDPEVPFWEQGNYAPVDETEVTDLEVTGSIPPELTGLYVRNGSNPPTGRSAFWFLGDGMVHGLRIERGEARWYRSRYVQTTPHRDGRELRDYVAPGQDVNQSNVAMVHHAGRFLTLGEVGWPYEVSTADLATVGPYDFAGKLSTWMTAHPKIDPGTGRMHFFGYWFAEPYLSYHVAEADGTLVHSEPVPGVPAATMIHDFAVTDRDVVFWQAPVMFLLEPELVESGFPFVWDEAGPSRIGVMPLGGPASAIRWVDVDPFMVFHGFNAHREGDDVVVQVHQQTSAFGPDGYLLPSYLTEWRIDTSGPQLTVDQTQLSDVYMDMPTVDRRLTGRKVRHGWCTTVDGQGPYGWEFAGLDHVDLQTGKHDRWEPGDMERAGEAFYVPAGDSAPEGEGWALSWLYDRTVDRSSLGVFDAADIAAGPIARVHLPVRVPYGFHGLWIPDAA